MLAKGHHLPKVTLVAIVDGDQGLYGTDFRAGERMAQQLIQVAGRTGRAEDPGQVVIRPTTPITPCSRCCSARAIRRSPPALLGPVPAPMERHADRYRWHLLVQTRERTRLQAFLRAWLPLGALGDRSTTTVNISHFFVKNVTDVAELWVLP